MRLHSATMDLMKCDSMETSETNGNVSDSIIRLKNDHTRQRDGLSLSKRPYDTLKYFTLAMLERVGQLASYMVSHRQFLLLIFLCAMMWFLLFTTDGPHEQLVQELLAYSRYVIWWVGLGVASSIGLGSGLHTFVLYLGPHIAMFTIKATLCGRVDLKISQYDTPVFGIQPTWALKDCSEFGPSVYQRQFNSERFSVPLMAILHQVHLEAMLWGIGTAIGELPPYFLSRAASLAGERVRRLDDLAAENPSDTSDSGLKGFLNKMKFWMITNFKHFNFWTILIFASVPNPLFDLAGMMCGHLLVPFWKFFIPTLIGKAIIKTHIQTIFIIVVCNNHLIQLLDRIFKWVFQHIPSVSHLLSYTMSQLQNARIKYDNGSLPLDKGAPKIFSFSLAWNTFVWIMLIGFFSSIINATAQGYLVEKQRKEIAALEESEKSLTTQ